MLIVRLLLAGLTIAVIMYFLADVHQNIQTRKTESFYTESVDEARRFSKQCYARNSSVLGVLEHSFGAWELFCKWREE